MDVLRIGDEQSQPLTLLVGLRGMIAGDQVSPSGPGIGAQGRLNQALREVAHWQRFLKTRSQSLQIGRERLQVEPVDRLHVLLPGPFKSPQQSVVNVIE